MHNPNDPINAEWFSAYIDDSVLNDLDIFWYNNSKLAYSKEFIDHIEEYKWKDYEEFEKYVESYKEFDR